MCLGRNSIASRWNYSKTIPNCVLAEFPPHPIGIILRLFQIVSQPKFSCISSKLLYDNSNCVLAKIQLHLIGIILRQFQIVSWRNFHCMSSKLFWDFSRLCLSQNSIAPQLIYSNTFSNCVIAQIHLLLIEIILRQFLIVS